VEKKQDDAIKRFKEVLAAIPGHPGALQQLVGIYMRKGEKEKAIELCNEQIKKAPKTAHIYKLLGQIALASKDSKKAEKMFLTAIEKDENYLPSYFSLALLYRTEGRLEDAIKKYEEILKKRPQFAPGYLFLGMIREQQAKYKDAEEYYRKALDIAPRFGAAANNLAWILSEHGGNIDEALKFAQQAKAVLPEDPRVNDTIGWIYHKKGSNAFAISYLLDAMEKLPKEPLVHYHLALAYKAKNEKDKAIKELEEALKLNPNFSEAEKARSLIEELKKQKTQNLSQKTNSN